MSVPGGNSLLLAAASVGGGVYEIERSLRFDGDRTNYLARTPSTEGNTTTWTWSGWVKRSETSVSNAAMLFTAGTTSNDTELLYFASDDKLRYLVVDGGVIDINFETYAVFRDCSAWYHIVATRSSGTFNYYVNGVQQSFQTSTSTGDSYFINKQNIEHVIGARVDTNYSAQVEGYLADVHFIDGQALAPTNFGEFDDNGVWQPKAYAGTYGTNGFHLDFSDNSSVSALGTDSANGNNWTANNFVPSAPTILFGEDQNDSSFDDSATSLTLDTTGYSYSALATSPLQAQSSADAARVIRSSNGSSFTATFTTSGSRRYIWTSSNGINWSSPGIEYETANTPAVITAPWIAWSGGANAPTTTVAFNTPAQVDSLLDSPTNGTQTDTGAGGEVSGNYCTFNPEIPTTYTLVNGGLDASFVNGTGNLLTGTLGVSSGKWYWEITVETNGVAMIGIADFGLDLNSQRFNGNGGLYYYQSGGNLYGGLGRTSVVSAQSYGSSYTTGDTIGVALDMDSNPTTLVFYKNNTSQGTATNATMAGKIVGPAYTNGGGATEVSANFGQRPFRYSAPSGYKALCTANLADPDIVDGSTGMDVKLYTGTEASLTVSGYNFSPDFVWRKGRQAVSGNITESPQHLIFDTVRGAGKRLQSNTASREDTGSTTLTAFTSDGFTLGSSTDGNDAPQTYVAWAWDAGSTTVDNTDGDVTSSVRANPTYGFSIVKWNPDSNGQSVGHGLNAVPEFIMSKSLDNDHSWRVYHKDLTAGNNILLDTSQGETTYNGDIDTVSTTVFDGGQGLTGSSLNNNIAYCFTSIPGYSKFGFYVSNNNANGPFVYLGFRPRYVLIKCISGSEAWVIYDSERYDSNFNGYYLRADSAANEPASNTESFSINMVSNGFKVNGQWGGLNDTNTTDKYIYCAFAENPIKFSRAK